jgi:hypothetical protein
MRLAIEAPFRLRLQLEAVKAQEMLSRKVAADDEQTKTRPLEAGQLQRPPGSPVPHA